MANNILVNLAKLILAIFYVQTKEVLEGFASNSTKLRDPDSFSNIDQVLQKNMRLNLTVDFEKQILEGFVEIDFVSDIDNLEKITLDSKNLDIKYVTDVEANVVPWRFDEERTSKVYGVPLVVTLPKPIKAGDVTSLRIYYKTIKSQNGLQWVKPENTFGKKYSVVYSQGQTIYGRNLIPCQDTPSAKFTIKSSITISKPLVAIFSGQKVKESEPSVGATTYIYEQRTPMPSFMLSIAAGAFQFKKINERTGVYAEKEVLANATLEFSETETFIKTMESYLTPLNDTSYNILVVPQSFPFGGFAYPGLSIVSPSILAGDKSLTKIISHDICHLWTGFAVTNQDWKNYWLNEGFTVFLQRKIDELIYGVDSANLEYFIGSLVLQRDVKKIDPNLTSLYPEGRYNPDDYLNTFTSDKGALFLYYLQSIIGNKEFQTIVKTYITTFSKKTIEVNQFKKFVIDQVTKILPNYEKVLSSIDWDAWVYGQGLLPVELSLQSKYIDRVNLNVTDMIKTQDISPSLVSSFKAWHSDAKSYFLIKALNQSDEIGDTLYYKMADLLGFRNDTFNEETISLWYLFSLKNKKEDFIPNICKFLATTGRIKFLEPLYNALNTLNPTKAKEVFEANKQFYHPYVVDTIASDLYPKSKLLKFLQQ